MAKEGRTISHMINDEKNWLYVNKIHAITPTSGTGNVYNGFSGRLTTTPKTTQIIIIMTKVSERCLG